MYANDPAAMNLSPTQAIGPTVDEFQQANRN
jgi:hypothetical protein